MTDDTPLCCEACLGNDAPDCRHGHMMVSDGITIDRVHLWHCARCGAGVRLPVRPAPEPNTPWLLVLCLLMSAAIVILAVVWVVMR